MLNFLVAGGLAASLVVSPVANPAASPPSEKITVEVVTVNGSGCAGDSAKVAVAPDNTAFTVTYSEFLAQVGVGAEPTDIRKNCQLSLLVHVPQGFTYAIAQVDHRGFAYLEKGAKGLQRASYYFQGDSATTYLSHAFAGPMNDDWQTTDATDVPSPTVRWPPAGPSSTSLPSASSRWVNFSASVAADGSAGVSSAWASSAGSSSTAGGSAAISSSRASSSGAASASSSAVVTPLSPSSCVASAGTEAGGGDTKASRSSLLSHAA